MLPDRHLLIPPGKVLHTGYVDVFDCVLACRERMSIGDLDRSYQRCLQLGENSMHPCPNGIWIEMDGRRVFVIEDGRHEWLASLMLGRKYMLVAWLGDAP